MLKLADSSNIKRLIEDKVALKGVISQIRGRLNWIQGSIYDGIPTEVNRVKTFNIGTRGISASAYGLSFEPPGGAASNPSQVTSSFSEALAITNHIFYLEVDDIAKTYERVLEPANRNFRTVFERTGMKLTQSYSFESNLSEGIATISQVLHILLAEKVRLPGSQKAPGEIFNGSIYQILDELLKSQTLIRIASQMRLGAIGAVSMSFDTGRNQFKMRAAREDNSLLYTTRQSAGFYLWPATLDMTNKSLLQSLKEGAAFGTEMGCPVAVIKRELIKFNIIQKKNQNVQVSVEGSEKKVPSLKSLIAAYIVLLKQVHMEIEKIGRN